MAKRPEAATRQTDHLVFPMAESLGNQIRVASRLFDRAIANRLKDFGIPYGIWGFLRQLWRQDGQTQLEISSLLDLSPATAVTAVDRMEKLDLIRRERSSTDRRNVHIYLTKKGKALESQLLPIAVEVNKIAASNITKRDYDVLLKGLEAIHESLRADDMKFTRDNDRRKLRRKLKSME